MSVNVSMKYSVLRIKAFLERWGVAQLVKFMREALGPIPSFSKPKTDKTVPIFDTFSFSSGGLQWQVWEPAWDT